MTVWSWICQDAKDMTRRWRCMKSERCRKYTIL